jgi:hypothetical protein
MALRATVRNLERRLREPTKQDVDRYLQFLHDMGPETEIMSWLKHGFITKSMPRDYEVYAKPRLFTSHGLVRDHSSESWRHAARVQPGSGYRSGAPIHPGGAGHRAGFLLGRVLPGCASERVRAPRPDARQPRHPGGTLSPGARLPTVVAIELVRRTRRTPDQNRLTSPR